VARLATIDDLLNGDPGEVEQLLLRASRISSLFEEHLEEDDGGEKERHWGIHASELQCARKAVYSLSNTDRVGQKIDKAWKRRFKIGHAIHDMFQADFVKLAKKWRLRPGWRVTFEPEVPIRPDLQETAADWIIYSHCDGLFVVRDEDDVPLLRIVLEMKSMSPAEYEKLRAPKPEHVEQATVYMKCLDAPVTWFLYYNKGNQNYTSSSNPSFFVKFDPDVWSGIEKKLISTHAHAAKSQLPARQESVGCEFCAFAWTCQPAYLRKKGIHTPNAKWLRMVKL
jgi:hypothetical protein